MRWIVLTALMMAGCSSSNGAGDGTDSGGTSSSAPASSVATTDRCIVRLHGKGGIGQPTVVVDGITEVSPTGNADGWNARQWLYFPDESFTEARDVVATALDETSCTTVVIDGFSNGAAFAAKLYCSGETFGGTVVGVVVDDPVTDASAANCQPAASVEVALYWTTALEAQSAPGTDCGAMDWTCEGGTLIGIDAYSGDLGASVMPSPFSTHEWYRDAPEIEAWLAA